MSSYQDSYGRSSSYDYRDRNHRSPDRDYDRCWRGDRDHSDSSSDLYRSKYRDRSPREYRSDERRSRDDRKRRHHRSRESSRERSYSNGRKSPKDDSDSDRYSRDRYYDDRRDDRRHRSYEDDRSSRGSYDSCKSKRDSDYGHSEKSRTDKYGRVKDEWLAHVWGDGNRPDNISFGMDSDTTIEHYDRSSYKSQIPNKTLIIRGLGPYVTEKDIREEVIKVGGNPKDIRLIRKKDTGSSRGFAFVEFHSTEEARSIVERHDGEFKLLDQRVIMQYSIQRDFDKEASADWYCRCCALNFKRREFCYRCGSDRKISECLDSEEGSSHPTHTVMLKGLDLSTTEENVLKAIQTLSSLPIRSVRIGRDKITNVSRGICYLEMNTVSDAMYLHNTLLTEKLRIDGRLVYVSYCKNIPLCSTVSATTASNAGNAAIAAAQWSHQKSDVSQYTLNDVPKLAEYSASLYAKTSSEREAYIKHYTEYYTRTINEGGMIPSLDGIGSNPSSTGYQDPITTMSVTDTSATTTNLPMATSGEPPSGAGDYSYPIPDVSTYQYDKTSGYYYDPYTTLYYDANSQYYFNSKINKFLYWDGTRNTYLLAPSSADTNNVQSNTGNASTEKQNDGKNGDDDKKGGKEKTDDKDKVKVAKRIAKDMEKWAKTLNHKKEIAKQNLIAMQVAPVLKAQGAADIGYTVGVLGKKDSNLSLMNPYLNPNTVIPHSNDSLVAEYGQGSESDEDNEDVHQDDKHVDWAKMACLLCKRAFPNKETLLKHQQLSDLHKQNLEAFYRSTGISVEDARQKSVQYRDRAKERRLKYNEPDVPPANRLKENYMKAREATVNYEQPTRIKIGDDNVGNKLLQKMGWQEGMGLGKKNQGRTDIIQAEARPVSAGLGIRTQGVTPGPGETYKDCVKKMMRSRYEEVDNR
ncbi:hypothetical protein PGB90_008984 [Kerria lacca]